ncbi:MULTISPECIES: SDR family NAD(P)-dependent oxidoreductase [unclassified Pseudofrankia]|uniref:SDR family NAD(P)-dependent oxidoreductase n=1 Tax=unclassified Pseudofrankia TaxID=2994372 RepID=UPI0008DA64A1|nr:MULTISPECIES: SDR family NAD(P)-dependent oxidoreductase [unclassified Pseudofrankia]MDT3444224.1 SDR family NAD(P)-dependent oxidoreductase [Pseudofrankia sp. BMG5.37]OHV65217.1 short-chain dehydrogenase [Pseudofrankia sp. BMG5.36]
MSATLTDFAGKVVVITGGAAGIGRALGEAFGRAGAVVVLADIEKGALDATAAELSAATGAEVSGVVTDVSDPASVEALADDVFRRHGRTHVLVNNAGVGPPSAKAWETTPNDWRWTFGVNVYGVANGVRAFLPRMIASGEPGHVVNTSSGDGAVAPMPGASVYAASKAAVATLTECLGAQLTEQGHPIGVSLFLPAGKGLLATGLWTSDRNRPAELAREAPRATPALTIESLTEAAAKAGHELPLQPLDEVAADVLRGILAGEYVIMLGRDGAADTLRERAERFAAGLNPTSPGHTLLPV